MRHWLKRCRDVSRGWIAFSSGEAVFWALQRTAAGALQTQRISTGLETASASDVK